MLPFCDLPAWVIAQRSSALLFTHFIQLPIKTRFTVNPKELLKCKKHFVHYPLP